MPKIWSHATIRELLTLALTTGESSAVLGSSREAELFRFAIYGFRRGCSDWDDLSITLDENKVIVTKRIAPTITILQTQES